MGVGKVSGPALIVVSIFIFLLFVLPAVPARAATSPEEYSAATIVVSVNGYGQISEGFSLLSYETTLFPKSDERQEVTCSREILPAGIMNFSWSGGSSGTFPVGYSCTVKTRQVGIAVSGREQYPLPELAGPDSQRFLVSSEKVRVTPETVLLAKSIIGGATTEFEALSLLADFVNGNISYNSSYFGRRLDSSEVLRVRQGVCEEFAHLFIALARSAGIPARYVGGFAWGGRGEPSFGAHGWAEAYFPGKGWVPFDPTTGFGQYGWLDASHVKFYTGEEAARTVEQGHCESRAGCPTLSWKGLLPAAPAFEVSAGTGNGQVVSIESVSVLPATVFSGSSALANVTLRNLLSSAVFASPSPLYGSAGLEESERLSLLGQGAPLVLLPGERRSWFFVVGAPREIERNYYYKYPVTASLGGAAFRKPAELTAISGRGAAAALQGNYVRISGGAGTYSAIQLDGGKETKFALPASGIFELPVLGFSGKTFLTTGNYLEFPERSAGEPVSVSVPPAVYSGESVDAVVFSTEPVTAIYSGREYQIPSGGGTIPLGTVSEAQVTIRLGNGTEENIFKKITRIPKPEVSVPLPTELPVAGKVVARPVSRISNGRVLSERIDGFPERDGGYFISGERCGTVSIKYEVEYEDLAGRRGVLRGNSVAKVSCSSSRLGELISSFFAWLFGGG